MYKCLCCKDTGWVCENHLDKPWGETGVEGSCNCGAGTNCSCNPDGNADGVFDAVYASVDPDNVKTWVQ